jgi:uncharacterized protein (TIRG00374 family)
MKRIIKIFLALIVTALAAWLSFRNIEWRTLKNTFTQANYFFVVLAVANSMFTLYALGWRWQILLKAKDKISMAKLFRLNIISQYVNILMPARMGEIVRAYMTSIESNASGGYAMGTIVIERLFDFMAFTIFWILMPAVFPFKEKVKMPGLALFFCFLAAGFLAMFALRPQLFLRGTRYFAKIFPHKIREKISHFADQGIEAFASLRSAQNVVSILFLTIGLILSQVLTNFLLFKAFHINLSFGAALFVLLAVQVGNIPPSAPGKIGIFEYAVILALSIFHVSKNEALSYGLMLHLVAFLPKIVLGFLLLSTFKIANSKRMKLKLH